ncbi:hypothetical protein BDV96DRAFT_672276 [Lophiotrema nucula]|uniref:Uncharacterized protein n=1 Tax=Lophiotrema nucula TaxID=690887 RepID=A0A6A5YM66_9PLEO|nr:hypothetical protein BDV96DRAFT_672276 [Lophiotrema nucula]
MRYSRLLETDSVIGRDESDCMRALQAQEVQMRPEVISQAQCRYPEGGKRGIPAAYITSLEQRLLETEAALFAALAAVQRQDDDEPNSVDWPNPIMRTAWSGRTKIDRQEEWRQFPLESAQQLAAWYQAKRQHSEAVQAPDAELASRGDASFESESARNHDPQYIEPSIEIDLSHQPQDVTTTLETPPIPVHESSDVLAKTYSSAQWRNYF